MLSQAIQKRVNVGIFVLSLSVLFACNQATEQATTEPAADMTSGRPNILVILADDMGFGDMGAYGSEIETPNIDSLARDGIQFTNFHVGAACSPTRTMLITGVDNHLAGLGDMLEIMADNQFGKPGYEGHLNDSVVSVATLLRDGGYNTYMAGKWHLGQTPETIPHGQGFERSFALMESGADNWVKQPYLPSYEAVHYYEDDREVDLPDKGYFSSADEVIRDTRSNLRHLQMMSCDAMPLDCAHCHGVKSDLSRDSRSNRSLRQTRTMYSLDLSRRYTIRYGG